LRSKFLSDLREHLGAKQFDALQNGSVRHTADIHLENVSRVAEEFVQVQDALGDLVRAAREHHAAALKQIRRGC
jgi:agmatine/peptidylarginine deiminase